MATHSDRLAPFWSDIITLDEGETLESLGWSRTGKVGLPAKGFAMLNPRESKIYVRAGELSADDGAAAEELAEQVYRTEGWEILQPTTVIA